MVDRDGDQPAGERERVDEFEEVDEDLGLWNVNILSGGEALSRSGERLMLYKLIDPKLIVFDGWWWDLLYSVSRVPG